MRLSTPTAGNPCGGCSPQDPRPDTLHTHNHTDKQTKTKPKTRGTPPTQQPSNILDRGAII